IFMFYLDLDELDLVARKAFPFSHNRKNLYSFLDRDNEPAGPGSVKERVLAFLRRQNIELGAAGRIMLLTLPRVAGYIFNPISIYFCFGSDGTPICSIAEVGNTLGEMKLYLLDRNDVAADGRVQKIVPKHFYVSPFSRLDLEFDFKLRGPGEKLE